MWLVKWSVWWSVTFSCLVFFSIRFLSCSSITVFTVFISSFLPPILDHSANQTWLINLSFVVLSHMLTHIFQNLLSTCSRVPEVQGTLIAKDFSKKSWNKKFFILRGSGLYCSNKGKSKVQSLVFSIITLKFLGLCYCFCWTFKTFSSG